MSNQQVSIVIGTFICLAAVSYNVAAYGKSINYHENCDHVVIYDTLNPRLKAYALERRDHRSDTLQLKKRTDSLQFVLNKSGQDVDSIQSRLFYKRDSMSTALSSIQSLMDTTIRQIDLNSVNSRVSSVSHDITVETRNKIEKLTDKATDKVKDLTDANPEVPTISVPGLPNATLPATTNTPAHELGLPAIQPDLPDIEAPRTNVEVPEIEQPNISLPQIDNVQVPEDINNLQEQAGTVTSSLQEVKQYQEEIGKIKKEDLTDTETLSKKAEQQAENLDQVKGVKENVGRVSAKQTEYQSMIQRYRDKKMVQEELKRKIANVANEKISQSTPAINEAQGLLLKGKKIRNESVTFKELMKGKNNAMSSKPFIKRLVPGIALQVYNRNVYTADLAIQLGYRLSGKITAGIGGVYRFGFNKSYTAYTRGLDVYGARLYTQFLVKKGFFMHTEGEWLNTSDMAQPVTTEQPVKKVIAGYFGIGKQYTLTRRLQGNVVVLYRKEFAGQLPEQPNINVRLGFNLHPKKKKPNTST